MEVHARKHILIPTDFATCAVNAMELALLWAQTTPAYLHFFHRIGGMPADWLNMTAEEQYRYPQIGKAIELLREQFAPWRKRLKEEKIEFRLSYAGGTIVDNVIDYVEVNAIDYIFIGSYGQPVVDREKFGSNAELIVRAVDIPVLIAKEEPKETIRQVIFASSFDKVAMDSFRVFLNLIEPFKPEIHLLTVDNSSFYKMPRVLVLPAMKEFKELANGFDVKLHFYPDRRVERGILQFSEEVGADLVALAQHSDRLFHSQRLNKSLKRLIHSAGIPIALIDQPLTDDS